MRRVEDDIGDDGSELSEREAVVQTGLMEDSLPIQDDIALVGVVGASFVLRVIPSHEEIIVG